LHRCSAAPCGLCAGRGGRGLVDGFRFFVRRPGGRRLRPRRLGRFGLGGRTRRRRSRQLLPSVPRSTWLYAAVARWPASGAGVVAERHGGQDRAAAHRGLDEVAAHKKDSLPAPWLLRAVGAENPVASCDLQTYAAGFRAGLVVAPGWPLAPSGGQRLAITGISGFVTPAESEAAPSTELEASRTRRENTESAPG
jgi:hypothetical protein